MQTKTIDGIKYIGVLEVPELSLQLPVMSHWSLAGLKIAPGRYAAEITEMVNKQFDLELKVSQIESCKRNHNIKSGIDSKFKKGKILHGDVILV